MTSPARAPRPAPRSRPRRRRAAGGQRETEHPVLALQRTAGNAAVTTLVQRDTEAFKGLSSGQASQAVGYYRRHPKLFTPETIQQLRAALKLPGGGIDQDLAQAVAVFQANDVRAGFLPGNLDLAVDGEAGPHTLPRILATGLEDQSKGTTFGEAAQHDVFDQWANLTPDSRVDALGRDINASLAALQVPIVKVDPKSAEEVGQASGSFSGSGWSISINKDRFVDGPVPDDPTPGPPSQQRARKLAENPYHEARHAEQRWAMARLKAPGLTAEKLSEKVDIHIDIAKKAKEEGVAPPEGGEATEAQMWFDEEFGAGKAHHRAAEDKVVAEAKVFFPFKKVALADPTPQNLAKLAALRTRFEKAFRVYEALATENDAYATQSRIDPGVTSPKPVKAAAPEPGAGDLVPVDDPDVQIVSADQAIELAQQEFNA